MVVTTNLLQKDDDDDKNQVHVDGNHRKHCRGSVHCRLSSREGSKSPRSSRTLDPLQVNSVRFSTYASLLVSRLFSCLVGATKIYEEGGKRLSKLCDFYIADFFPILYIQSFFLTALAYNMKRYVMFFSQTAITICVIGMQLLEMWECCKKC